MIALPIAEPRRRYRAVQLILGGRYGIEDGERVIVRDIASRCAAEVVASVLNDANEDVVFYRDLLCRHGILPADGPALATGRG